MPLVVCLLMGAAGMGVFAAPVDEDAAVCAAENFLVTSRVAARILPEREVASVTRRGALWIARLEPSGHIVVSGSTKCPPVVSFSAGDFEEPEEDSPRKVMLDAAEAVAIEREADDSITEHSGWTATPGATGRKRLLGEAPPSESEPFVGPLMTSRWYQTAPLNDFTPLHKVCGCVATAAAQEIRYWQWPYRMESTRTSTHNLVNHERQTYRVNGAVPFSYGKICDTYDGGMMTANAIDHTKEERFALAYLSLWMQSLVNMSYNNGGSGSGTHLNSVMPFYETGYRLNTWDYDYETVRNAVIGDIVDFGSPIQVWVPSHAVVADGFAVDDGTDWIHLNYGYAKNPDNDWYDMGEACTNGEHRIQQLEINFHPQKTVQIDPLPRVCTSSVPVTWHIPPCYTNTMTGFEVSVCSSAAEAVTFNDEFSDEKGIATSDGLSVSEGKLRVRTDRAGIYTYPDMYLLTESSELSFGIYSWYMFGSTVFVEARDEYGEWSVLREVSLNWHSSGEEVVNVSLGKFAGRVMQFRFRLAYQSQSYSYGGNGHIGSLYISNVHPMNVAVKSETIPAIDDGRTSYSHEIGGLEDGTAYSISVTPIMADADDSSVVARTVSTICGTPAGEPSFESISVPYDNIELLQEGFYAECGIGVTNEIVVTCSESTTGLVALSGRPSLVPDEKVSIATNANVFTISIDTTEIADEWSGDMIMLTIVANNADDTQAYTNLMLRFAKPCQIFNGTYDVVASGIADKPIELCGTSTILDAGANRLVFGDGMFTGSGNVTLVADAAEYGGFVFDGLDGFTGTINVSGDYATIAGHVPADAKFSVSSGAKIVLAGADVATKSFSGDGTLVVTSGENIIENIEDSLLPVRLEGGTLTIGASEEQMVALVAGTLKIRLSDEQVAFGHEMTFDEVNDATIEFIDPDCETIDGVTQDGLTFIAPAADSTKIWTPNGSAANYSDESCWSGGELPQDGDNVIFDATQDVTMIFDLPETIALNALYIKGEGRLEIAESGENTLSAVQLFNKAALTIDTPQLINAQLLTASDITLASPSCSGCEIFSTLAGYLKMTNGADAVTNDVWRGTVIYTGTLTGLNPNSIGNANSVVRLNGTSGYLAYNATFVVPVELVDDGGTPALLWNNGSSYSTATFSSLIGDGTFKLAGSGGNGEKIVINDISSFRGSFDLSSKTVAIGSRVLVSAKTGLLDINNGYTANIAQGAVWRIDAGVVLDGANSKLDVAGELHTTNITAHADNAQLVLSDGGLIAIHDFPLEGRRINATLYGGTLRFGTDATATDGICFSSTNDTFTTLDVNGNTLTFAEGAISGHGTIYPTSTASSPGMVVFENLGYFSGTVIIDGTTEVQLPSDLSDTDATIALRAGGMTFAAGCECAVIVSEGATLTLTLTAEQMSAGYVASGVTLDGGVVEFRDLGGNLLKTITSGESKVESVSLEEIGGYVSTFPSLAFKNRDLSALTSDSLKATFGGSNAEGASGQAVTFCLINHSDGVMTCEAQVLDGAFVKGVALAFSQYGDDIHVVAAGTGVASGVAIGEPVVGDGGQDEASSPDYKICNLRLASVATITDACTLEDLFGQVSEESELVIKTETSATLSIPSRTAVADVIFDIADGTMLTLVGETLSAGSVTVKGRGGLVVDASGRDVSDVAVGDRLKILGGSGLDGVEVLLPDAANGLRFILERADDGLYMIAIPDRGWNTINLNFTHGGGNITTEDDVGLVGVPGTMWNNMPGVVGSTSVVYVVDRDNSVSFEWPGLAGEVSGTRGSWACTSLASASNLRHGYIDEANADGQRTPTVVVSGIPFDSYRVIVYHATDTGGAAFGYDTINGDNLTYVDGLLAAGTSTWGNAGGGNSALAIAEGINTLVSGIYTNSTLTVVGHKDGSARGCIAAVQVVKVETAEIDSEGDYHLEELFGDVGATSDLVLYVNESATLNMGSETMVGSVSLNVAAGKSLTVTWGEGGGAARFAVGGSGRVEFADAPTNRLGFAGEGDWRWTGTVVMGWTVSSQTSGTAWILDDYGIAGSTVEVSKDITAGYFKDPVGSYPSVKPAAYFCGDVTINNGYSTSSKVTTFSSVGMAEGKTFKTRGSDTYYTFTELAGFEGTILVRGNDHVKIGTIVRAAVPEVGEVVANVVANSANAVIDDIDDVVIAVENSDRRIPAVYDSASNGFVAATRQLSVPAVENATFEVVAGGQPCAPVEDGVYTFVYGTDVVVTYTADTYYRVSENGEQTFTLTNDCEAVAPTVVYNMVDVTIPSVEGAVLTGVASDSGEVFRLDEDGNKYSVPAGSVLTLTWEAQEGYVFAETTTIVEIGAEAVEFSVYDVAPPMAVAQGSDGTCYADVQAGVAWLYSYLNNGNQDGYLQLLGVTGDNVYGAYGIGYDEEYRRYAKAVAFIDFDGDEDPGFLTLQAALDAVEIDAPVNVRLLSDIYEKLTLVCGKVVTINALHGDDVCEYAASRAEDESYTVVGEASGTEGATTYTARDWHEWTVVYVNWDGTTIQTTTVFEYAPTTPEYTGETPMKEATPEFDYTFVGWYPEIAETVAGDVMYTAQFAETIRSYTVTWIDDDGVTILGTTNVTYGTRPSWDAPGKELEPPYRQLFDRWEPALAVVTNDAQYTATYQAKFADISTLTNDWTAADGDVIVNSTQFAVRIPGGASVMINGVRVTGMGSDASPVASPEFAAGASAEVSKFERGADGRWTLTAFAELANDASGMAVEEGQVRVFCADSPAAIDSAAPMTAEDGLTLQDKKSAVKMTFKVDAPSDTPAQFFKVVFGETEE